MLNNINNDEEELDTAEKIEIDDVRYDTTYMIKIFPSVSWINGGVYELRIDNRYLASLKTGTQRDGCNSKKGGSYADNNPCGEFECFPDAIEETKQTGYHPPPGAPTEADDVLWFVVQ